MAKKKPEGLSPKEILFCSCFTSIGTTTFSHKQKSAKAAGYTGASASNQATRLLRRPDIQAEICAMHSKNMARNLITTDKVLSDLEHDKFLAREKSDIATAVRCDELQGKFLALFVDRQIVDQPAAQALDEGRKAEAVKLARMRLSEKYGLLGTGTTVKDLDASEKSGTDEDLPAEKGLTPQVAS